MLCSPRTNQVHRHNIEVNTAQRGEPRAKLTQNQALAAILRRDLMRIAARERCPEPDRLRGWCDIFADVLRPLHGTGWWRLNERSIRRCLPAHWQNAVTSSMIRDAIAKAKRSSRHAYLPPPGIIGEGIAFTNEARARLQDDGYVVSLVHAIDETEEEREGRRRDRRREKNREYQRRCRARKLAAVNVATGCQHPIKNSSLTPPATLQRDQIVAAIRAGASATRELIAVTDLPSQTIRSWLTRLKKAGAIEQVSRGRWRVRADEGSSAVAPRHQPVRVSQPVEAAPEAPSRPNKTKPAKKKHYDNDDHSEAHPDFPGSVARSRRWSACVRVGSPDLRRCERPAPARPFNFDSPRNRSQGSHRRTYDDRPHDRAATPGRSVRTPPSSRLRCAS